MSKIKVLHIGEEKNWRGGENQIRHLILGSQKQIEHHVAYPKTSRGFIEFSKIVPTLALPQRRGLINVLKIINYCKKMQIQILDAQSAAGHRQALMVKRFLPNLKIVVHRRVDNPIKKWSRGKYLNSKVDVYVAISNAIKNILIANGIDEKKISLIPSAVDKKKYEKLEKNICRKNMASLHGLDTENIWLGNASAFTEQKGYVYLIEALDIINKEGLPFQAILAGDGPLLEPMKKLVIDKTLEDKVVFLGHIKEVENLLRALDILVYPSINEGLGTLVMDAIYAGCSVVASRVGGIPEMIINNETGLLCEAKNSVELANNMQKLLEDSGLRERLHNSALRHIEKNFSLEQMVSKNAALYQSLV